MIDWNNICQIEMCIFDPVSVYVFKCHVLVPAGNIEKLAIVNRTPHVAIKCVTM